MGRTRKYTDEERKAKLAEYQRKYYERNRERLLEVAHRNYVKASAGNVSRRNTTPLNMKDIPQKENIAREEFNGALKSPENNNDIILEEMLG